MTRATTAFTQATAAFTLGSGHRSAARLYTLHQQPLEPSAVDIIARLKTFE
jgi:hypothetical protein